MRGNPCACASGGSMALLHRHVRAHGVAGGLQSSARRLGTASARPWTVAIVGSGPAGFYAADFLLKKDEHVRVSMFERLPVPFGLVRYGVAPDHQEVKNVTERFEQIASDGRFSFFGNVSVGRPAPVEAAPPGEGGGWAAELRQGLLDFGSSLGGSGGSLGPRIELDALRRAYDSVILAYGASDDRKLGIEGEDLPGVHAAREFVDWYNGHPEWRGAKDPFHLSSVETVAIIGTGNVALDCARLLTKHPSTLLRGTDVCERAAAALKRSRVREVVLLGRRGVLQAAFTIKELREISKLADVQTVLESPAGAFSPTVLAAAGADRPRKRLVELMQTLVPEPPHGAGSTENKTPENKTPEVRSRGGVRAASGRESVPVHHVIGDGADAGRDGMLESGFSVSESGSLGSESGSLGSESGSLVSESGSLVSGFGSGGGSAGGSEGDSRSKGGAVDWVEAARRVRIVLQCSPQRFDAGADGRLESISVQRTEMVGAPGPNQMARVIPGSAYSLPCQLALTSVGYRSLPIDGAPFDSIRGVVPNTKGRVEGEPGLYVAGWLKRGPSGVVLTNVGDAAETVAALLEDHRNRTSQKETHGGAGAGGRGGDAEIREILDAHGGQVVGFEAARRVAEAEARRGAAAGKVREKFVSVRELLEAARG